MSDYYDIFRTRELHKGRDNLRLHIIDPGLKIVGERKQVSVISSIFFDFFLLVPYFNFHLSFMPMLTLPNW